MAKRRNRRQQREVSNAAFLALNKYFLRAMHQYWAYMSTHKKIDEKYGAADFHKARQTQDGFELSLHFDFWCASLYAAIEGYEKLGMEYPRTERLLESPMFEKLRKYRHGTFHFIENYFDADTQELAITPDGINWVRELQLTFGQEMKEELERRRGLMNAGLPPD